MALLLIWQDKCRESILMKMSCSTNAIILGSHHCIYATDLPAFVFVLQLIPLLIFLFQHNLNSMLFPGCSNPVRLNAFMLSNTPSNDLWCVISCEYMPKWLWCWHKRWKSELEPGWCQKEYSAYIWNIEIWWWVGTWTQTIQQCWTSKMLFSCCRCN